MSDDLVMQILRDSAYWSAGVSHTWISNRRRNERDSSIASVAGKYRTKAEAIAAADDAIAGQRLYQVREWSTAKPRAYFVIPHDSVQRIGELLENEK